MADVSTEALQAVKNALTTFQADIDGIAQRASSCSDSVLEECKGQVNQVKSEISQVESQIAMLNKQISELECTITQATNCLLSTSDAADD